MGLTFSSTGKNAVDTPLDTLKRKNEKIIALAGNPNVGKSTLFNSLTGMNQHTGNWTGKTVTTAAGHCKSDENEYLFVDIPGTYSLCPRSAEEEVARDFICVSKPDAVVVVCDATCLERNLGLVYQIMEVTPNVVVCVNLIDEAKRKGITVDLQKLSEILGVAVVGTVARKKRSANQILSVLDSLEYKTSWNSELKAWQDADIENIMNKAEQTAKSVVAYKKEAYNSFDMKVDRIVTSKRFGYPLMLLMLLITFWLTIVGANYPSQLLSNLFSAFLQYVSELFYKLNAPLWLHGAIVDGVLRILCFVTSVMLPPMAIFFPLFTLLEDLGYLPRIAYNLDKPFQCCNACGKQALTMCMGFGCNAAGVTGCRIIDSKRERLIAILTNNFVPCNGRFPTLIAIITMFLVTAGGIIGSISQAVILTLFIVAGIAVTFLMSAFLSKTFLKGESSSFILELPPYRKPQICKTLVRSLFDRTLFVLGRAVAVAAPAGLVIWLMANISIKGISLLTYCSDFLDPIAAFIGMDGTILLAFLLGFPANEIVLPIIVMTYLAEGKIVSIEDTLLLKEILVNNGWTLTTALCTMTFSLFHFPCSTTVITVYKETKSIGWTLLSVMLPTVFGIALCFLINLIL